MKRRRARRLPTYHVRGPCSCSVCAEREQLHDLAQWSPAMPLRILAMTFLGAIEAVDQGRLGAFGLGNCFD